MPLTSTLSKDDTTLTISIVGEFGDSLMEDFRATYFEFIYCDMAFIIDFRQTERIDSSGLGILLTMRKLLGDSIHISIVNCRPEIKDILAYFRFDRKFDIT